MIKTTRNFIFILFIIISCLSDLKVELKAAQPAENQQNKTNITKLDTTNKNKIVKIWENNSGVLNITAKLNDNKKNIKVIVYNMLGKEVSILFNGVPVNKNSDGDYYFVSDTSLELPRGVYILVIQGIDFRIAEKFILTKQ
ncbi:MAG: hypothetical protein IJK61_01090 [Bacteroidetes bacterium]|nr:hypothetical protein [Bacteroidota bacterium]